jgi:hypothetical protein
MIKGVLTLILVEAETNLDRSASMLECFTSVSTVVVLNMPMWNPALAMVFTISGFTEEDF